MTSPGWYPDPAGSGGQRYWDGRQWAASGPPPRRSKPGNWKALAVVVAVGVGFPAVILAFLTVANNNRTVTTATETTTATATVTRQPSTPPRPRPVSIREWAAQTAPSVGTLGDAMEAVSIAATETGRRQLDYWANLNTSCRQLLTAASVVRGYLPAPDLAIDQKMNAALDNVVSSAGACATFGPGTDASKINTAADQLTLAGGQIREVTAMLRELLLR